VINVNDYVRAEKQKAMFRWDEFKGERAALINRYIAVKSKMHTAGHIAREIIVKRALLKLKKKFEARRTVVRYEEKGSFATLRMMCLHKLRITKQGGLDNMRRMDHKSAFTLLSHFTHQRAETSSKDLLLEILTKT